MNSFKITNLPYPDMKFKEWKVRENSKLSYGDAIFIYEYQTNGSIFDWFTWFLVKQINESVINLKGTTKKEKFKSNLNGITVSELAPFKVDDLLQKEYISHYIYHRCALYANFYLSIISILSISLYIKNIKKTEIF
jgi:hypothetical protein